MKKVAIYLITPLLLIPICFFGIALLTQGTPVAPQLSLEAPSRDLRVSISDDPRPLARAAELLQPKLGIAISYEDAPWIDSHDLVQAGDTPAGAEAKKTSPQLRAIVPSGGSLDLTFQLDPRSQTIVLPADAVLQSLLDQHVARGNPGTFRLVLLGNDGFSIVPTVARDAVGRTVGAASPLDVAISFPSQKRDGIGTLTVICEAITRSTGKKTELGTIPKLFFNSGVEIGAKSETAREVLLKTFRTLKWTDSRNPSAMPKFYWRLLYSPTVQTYFLNIRPVQQETLEPSGRTRLSNVSR